MATVKDTMRLCLFTYPSIFPSPLHVACQWFASIGSGFGWSKNGELVAMFKDDNSSLDSMSYDDIEEHENHVKSMNSNIDFQLEIEAERVCRKFIEDNIERVLNHSIVINYFGSNITGLSFVKEIHVAYSAAFNFPDNITKDWGDALYDFLEHWLYALNCEHGTHYDTWNEPLKKGRQAILDAKVRLYPLINNGKTYAKHIEDMNELMQKLFDK